MRMLGIGVVAATVLGAALYFGGFVGGNVDFELTDKGRQTVSDGLEEARKGVNNGLTAAQEKMNRELDSLKNNK